MFQSYGYIVAVGTIVNYAMCCLAAGAIRMSCCFSYMHTPIFFVANVFRLHLSTVIAAIPISTKCLSGIFIFLLCVL